MLGREGNSEMRFSVRACAIILKTMCMFAVNIPIFIVSPGAARASTVLSKNDAEFVVKKFCNKIITAKLTVDRADPNKLVDPAGQPEVYRQVVTTELADLYSRAVVRSAAVQGGKPVMGDGVWKSVQDAASGCLLGSISGARNRPKVAIRYVLVGESKPSVTDTLVLKKESGEWRVDDIHYDQSKYRLRSVLARAISEPISASR
ncbi:TPA: hypothetical protein QDC03_006914 [Burkholderia cepacia]|uniref:hypothetical protein n=1 Tax=Burkholderia cepacia TaxID=292 RepID=UPI0011B24652|nr:hypothetical protein [Burkholderia cepacia]HDR9511691.1 hypothetical protein [Burkholderia cepacia]